MNRIDLSASSALLARTSVGAASASDRNTYARRTLWRIFRRAPRTLTIGVRETAVEERLRREKASQQTLVFAWIWAGVIAFFALSAMW